MLYGFALRLTRRPEDAAEIVQETLLRACRTFDNFDGSNARAWLMPDAEILGALEALPERYRSVVTLVEIHDHSYEEAAAVLACPVGTVRSRLARRRSSCS